MAKLPTSKENFYIGFSNIKMVRCIACKGEKKNLDFIP
jgi:hypothetical protein